MRTRHILLLLAILVGIIADALAQVSEDSELFVQLKQNDSLVFDAAFNRCDTDTLKELFTSDLEFYHDKGGVTDGLGSFISGLEQNCAGREPGTPQPSKRILLPETLEVYPMYRGETLYAALQQGVHRFEYLENDTYKKGDVAKFTHLWVLEDDHWKIKRVLSYDHQPSAR